LLAQRARRRPAEKKYPGWFDKSLISLYLSLCCAGNRSLSLMVTGPPIGGLVYSLWGEDGGRNNLDFFTTGACSAKSFLFL
jgi:hypothetical protein